MSELVLIRGAIPEPNPALRLVILRTERRQLAKRVWRGSAADGREFGFELSAPLRHGETFFQDDVCRYAVEQAPEPVLVVALADLPPSAAAGVGWAVGNLHLELQSEAQRLLLSDEPAARQLLNRIGVSFETAEALFRPGRFARGGAPGVNAPSHEYGPSHRH